MKIMLSIGFGLMMMFISLDIRNTAGMWVLPSVLAGSRENDTHPFYWLRSRFERKSLSRKSQTSTPWDDIASSLAFQIRAGKTLVQAVDSVSKEGSSSAHKRLKEAYRLYETGVPISRAMEMISGGDGELSMIAGMLEIGSISGGNTAVLLWHVFEILRRRRIFRGEIKAKLSEAKMTSWILLAMPWLIGLFMIRHDPSLLRDFAALKEGRLLLVIALGLWLMGMALIMVSMRSVSSYASEGKLNYEIRSKTKRR